MSGRSARERGEDAAYADIKQSEHHANHNKRDHRKATELDKLDPEPYGEVLPDVED